MGLPPASPGREQRGRKHRHSLRKGCEPRSRDHEAAFPAVFSQLRLPGVLTLVFLSQRASVLSGYFLFNVSICSHPYQPLVIQQSRNTCSPPKDLEADTGWTQVTRRWLFINSEISTSYSARLATQMLHTTGTSKAKVTLNPTGQNGTLPV